MNSASQSREKEAGKTDSKEDSIDDTEYLYFSGGRVYSRCD